MDETATVEERLAAVEARMRRLETDRDQLVRVLSTVGTLFRSLSDWATLES